MMKQTYFLVLCFLFKTISSSAQFSVGPGNFLIRDGTKVNLYGLALIPAPDLIMANNNLTVSSTAVPGSPTNSINRVYSFNAPVNFSGVIGVFYKDDELNGNAKATLQISYSPTASGSFTITTGSVSDVSANYVSNSLAGNVGRVTAISPPALPVTLVRFNAVREEQSVKLDWNTSFETNSELFEIQSSPNATSWKAIGEVQALGESNQSHHYDFTDLLPSSGPNYYRLKMIDHDGTFAYSSARYIHFGDEEMAVVYPNPVTDQATLTLKDWSDVKSVEVTDLRGQTLFNVPNAGSSGKPSVIGMDGLPAGTYLIHVKRTDGLVHSLKIVRR